MYSLKGFIRIPSLANNDKDIVNPVGELSSLGYTYAKDKGIYTHSTLASAPKVSLLTFMSQEDDDVVVVLPSVADYLLEMGQWAYERGTDGSILDDGAEFIRRFNTAFPEKVGTQIGKMVSDGSIWLPDWISFRLTNGDVGANEVKIWFSDVSFRRQYDEYDITVIPPIENLDDFFESAAVVSELVGLQTNPVLMDLIQEKADVYPYTVIKSRLYDWLEKGNVANTVLTGWTVLIYGAAGNSDDLIREAIVDHILSNSTHGREDWIEIFPDLFKSTEYMLIPFWHRFSIPDRILQSGIYSPAINLKEAISVSKRLMVNYPSAHVDDYVSTLSTTYKSVALVACGGPDNRDKVYSIYGRHSDYIAVQTTSPDFSRMSAKTQGWVKLLNAMLIAAETVSEYSDVPAGVSRLNRDGIIYVSASYQRVQYIMVTKYSMNQLFG